MPPFSIMATTDAMPDVMKYAYAGITPGSYNDFLSGKSTSAHNRTREFRLSRESDSKKRLLCFKLVRTPSHPFVRESAILFGGFHGPGSKLFRIQQVL